MVADLSFISLTLALPPALAFAASGAWLVALVKPQFEVGKAAIGKGGIVRDPIAIATAVDRIVFWVGRQEGWSVEGVIPSPLKGGDGNTEFLLGARKASQR